MLSPKPPGLPSESGRAVSDSEFRYTRDRDTVTVIPSPSGPVRGKPRVSSKPGSESVTVRRTRDTVTWPLGHGPGDGTAPAAAAAGSTRRHGVTATPVRRSLRHWPGSGSAMRPLTPGPVTRIWPPGHPGLARPGLGDGPGRLGLRLGDGTSESDLDGPARSGRHRGTVAELRLALSLSRAGPPCRSAGPSRNSDSAR